MPFDLLGVESGLDILVSDKDGRPSSWRDQRQRDSSGLGPWGTWHPEFVRYGSVYQILQAFAAVGGPRLGGSHQGIRHVNCAAHKSILTSLTCPEPPGGQDFRADGDVATAGVDRPLWLV